MIGAPLVNICDSHYFQIIWGSTDFSSREKWKPTERSGETSRKS